MDHASLYDEDVETWAETQVMALRRLASRSPLANAVDWENVIEEIEALGHEKRDAVESLIENALVHILKLWADPDSLSARRWRQEIKLFLGQARDKAKPSMLHRIDMDERWRHAVRDAVASLDAFDRALPGQAPEDSPVTIADVLDPAFDVEAAVDALRGAQAPRA